MNLDRTVEATRLYESGASINAVATAIGLSYSGARHLLISHGVPLRSGGNYLLDADSKSEIVELYESGESMRQIAAAYGITGQSVRSILERRGVGLRPKGRAQRRVPGRKPLMSEQQDLQFAELYAQDIPIPKIAEQLGIARDQGFRAVDRLGLPKRPVRRGERSASWKGGVISRQGGYVMVRLSDDDPLASMRNSSGYAPEHRVVMARSLGRVLTRSETVHHKNGDKFDNRLENLQLRMGQHGKGVVMTCLDCGSHNVTADAIAD